MKHIPSGFETSHLKESRVYDIKVEPFRVHFDIEVSQDGLYPDYKEFPSSDTYHHRKAALDFYGVRSVVWIMDPQSNVSTGGECRYDHFSEIKFAPSNYVLIGGFGRMEIISPEPRLKFCD